MSLDFDPIEFYKQEFSSSQLHIKINAIHRLKLLASVIPASALESEILPFISDQLPLLEDEALFALSHQLSHLHLYFPDCGLPLLPILEHLAGSDETLVRDQAVISLIELAGNLPDYQIIHSFINTLFKLANSKQFQGKLAACKLFCIAYPRAGGFKDKIRNKLIEFCQDEVVIIRKAAVNELLNLVDMLDKANIVNEILQIVQKIVQDEQEDIRIVALGFIKKFCVVLGKEEAKTMAFPLLVNLQEDSGWKVRCAVAKELSEISKIIGKDSMEGGLLQVLINLLHDPENEVRVCMIQTTASIFDKLSQDKILNIYSIVSAYIKDDSINLKTKKVALGCLSSIWKVSDQEFCLKSIFPIFEAVFLDHHRELKIVAIENFPTFALIGSEFIDKSLKPLLRDSFNDLKSWRIRKKVLKCVWLITQKMGQGIFVESLYGVFFHFIRDSVAEVRNSGVKYLKRFVKLLDTDWVVNALFPKLQAMYLETTWYLHKITLIKILAILPGDYVNIFALASKDHVANVRITVCSSLLCFQSDKKDLTHYLQLISELKKDKDREVSYLSSLLATES